jgi:HEAT repeat protein
VDRAALAERVRAHLLPFFSPSGTDTATGPVARVHLDLRNEFVSIPGKAAERVHARLRIDIHPEGNVPGHYREDGQLEAEVTSSPDAAAASMRRLTERTLDELVRAYLDRQRLWLGEPKEVKTALNGQDPNLRLEAIRAVAGRKLVDEVPVLLQLLADEDEITRDTALGALVQMRDRRAVAELTRSRSMRDHREMRKIIDAVATIGGKEAADYLAFVADAHEDEELRTMARAALERLKRNSTNAQ